MSCNGCRVLRKGCSDECMLRHCLLWIENPQAQAHATVFVARFFGRAALMSFISSVPTNQRSALFQSLMYEAVGRTINPVSGAVGLLWSGKWHLCQLGVEKVLRGGSALTPLPDHLLGQGFVDCSIHHHHHQVMGSGSRRMLHRKAGFDDVKKRVMVQQAKKQQEADTTTLGSSPHDHCPSETTERKPPYTILLITSYHYYYRMSITLFNSTYLHSYHIYQDATCG